MRTILLFLGSIFLFSLFNSCEKCTDNGLVNEQYLGKYSVADSLATNIVPPEDLRYSHETYHIEIIRKNCDEIVLRNYANIEERWDTNFEVKIEMVGDSFFIPEIEIPVVYWGEYKDKFGINETRGFFRNDSIFMPLSFMGPMDPYIGACYGVKAQ